MERILIVCTPGLEKELAKEIAEVWSLLLNPQARPQTDPLPELKIIRGGIELACDLFRAVQFNFFLKLATRILWRLDEFKAKDFPRMYQKLKRVPWGQWLQGGAVDFHVSASQSRLNNEKRILELLKQVIGEASLPPKKSADVYLRVHQDLVTLSLDLSGEPLYKRLEEKQTGAAPFRETWAHFLLRQMIDDQPLGKTQEVHLVDPYAGSGTLLFEAAYFDHPVFQRLFAFQNLVQAPKLFKLPAFSHNYQLLERRLFKSYWGRDKDPAMTEKALKNRDLARQKWGSPSSPIEFENKRATAPAPSLDAPVWLVSNPPWGQRLKNDVKFESMLQDLIKAWNPERLALVLPAKSLDVSCVASEYKVNRQIPLQFAGTDVDFWILQSYKA